MNIETGKKMLLDVKTIGIWERERKERVFYGEKGKLYGEKIEIQM